MILLQSPPGMPIDSDPTTLSPSILPPSSSPRRLDHPSLRSSAVTPIPHVTSAILAFVAWSDSRGAPTIGTPHDRLSSIEFHPQWVTKQPTAVWDSAFTCEHHSTTRPCSPPPSSSTPASYLLSRRTTNRFMRVSLFQWKGSAPDSRTIGSENQQSSVVFPKGNPIPSVKALAFYRSSAFTVDAVYADVGDMQVPAKISTYTIGPFQTSKDERAKLIVSIESPWNCFY
ncbi:uncharacterized protein LOC135616886 isoform X1 [Musa acuminata AAA Group]|uniref:uncharacterized protein LOC135616886 isoform X1 n=1 Tax=Musa acuminata AAA Group TaxID=214697 RepID=UPI0031E338E6